MKHLFYIVILVFSFVFASCEYREREEQLARKEAQLNQWEEELTLRKKELDLREEELKKTTNLPIDTTPIINPAIPGSWEVKMTCTETTCPGSAVGDVRAEVWELSVQENTILAKATANHHLVRVYTGLYTGNTLELIEDQQKTYDHVATKMVVRLTLDESGKKMEGIREITRLNECKTVFSVKMEKL